MPQIHLRQPGYAYGACGSFFKNKERIQKLDLDYTRSTIYLSKQTR